ncbi:MAG TPA: hypothetical protein VFG14_07105 [Chthoniobacteraceae bacterium]|jgi:hypothetical protein|nr:hypothetical protein [Chthoniobacteraceae bacterium]
MNSVLALLGAAAIGALSGCATSLPVTQEDRRLLPTVGELIPRAPQKSTQTEEFRKQRWFDGVRELAYTYRGRHDGLPILVYSAVHHYPSADDAIVGRSESDNDHRRLFITLEQREADTFIPAGDEARTHLLFAGMQPVGLRFSTRNGSETFSVLCLAPPQLFDAHRAADILQARVHQLEQGNAARHNSLTTP